MELSKFEEICATTDLESSLNSLCSFGQPKLSKMDNGWYCRIDMFVSSEGASFEIQSNFDHKTPSDAVNTLIERLQKTLSDFKT